MVWQNSAEEKEKRSNLYPIRTLAGSGEGLYFVIRTLHGCRKINPASLYGGVPLTVARQ